MAFMKGISPAVIGIAVGSVLACVLIIVLLMKCIAYMDPDGATEAPTYKGTRSGQQAARAAVRHPNPDDKKTA